MSSRLSPSHGSAGERIDRICDGFERAFRQHEHPQIREYLKQIEKSAQSRLFAELVALEIDLLREGGLKPELDKYLADFPEYSQELNDLGQFGIVLEWSSDGQPPVSETRVWSPAEPESLDQFRLVRILGQGTFGIVWLARDTRLERDVALKVARQDRLESSDIDLFLREARAAANLAHPNIVAVHEIRNGQGVKDPYIVTALIDGPNLKNSPLMKGITPRKAAELTAKIARALHYAHRQGIVHRDLKPGNILLDAEDEPHLADFGLAESGDDTLSASGKLRGTPLYMAPEQATGHHEEVDARTDIYALGVILYELLTGQPPFRGALESLLYQISHSSPPRPRECRASVPVDLERICLKCLSKQRTARYQTAQDLAHDLDRYLNGESLRGINIPLPQRMQKWLWRNRRRRRGCGLVDDASRRPPDSGQNPDQPSRLYDYRCSTERDNRRTGSAADRTCEWSNAADHETASG
jgi:serine/threonine protein kinase